VASAEADLSFLWDVIGKIHFATAGYGYLVDEHGNLIAHKDAGLVLKRIDLRQVSGVQRFLRNPTRSDPTPAQEGQGLTGSPVLATYWPVPELGWAVILEEPLDAALANVEILKRSALVLLAIGLLVGAIVIAWVSGKMTGPILELHQGAKIIGSGNLDYRVNIKTGDEIEWLGEEFNKMAGELKLSYATLEQKVKDKTGELEKANSDLEQAYRSLLVATKAKDEFLSVMSHELRTPLNVIMGYTGMIKEGILGNVNAEQARALDKVVGRSSDLLIMINQILQATSIEAGKVQLDKRDVQLKDFLENLKSNYEIPLNNGIAINWDYPLDTATLHTDSAKLKHILQNLINNAIKFTPQGSISITAKYISQARAVQFQVVDTGIGISEELLPSIFEIFQQGDSSETRTYGGVGIGLYIVKKYTDLLGGEVEAKSALGKGTTFTLTIPVDSIQKSSGT
jgi:signal transduction histidine kinase